MKTSLKKNAKNKSELTGSKKQNEKKTRKRASKAVRALKWREYKTQIKNEAREMLEEYGLSGHESYGDCAYISLMEALLCIYALMNKGKTQLRGPDGFHMPMGKVYSFLESLFQHKDFCVFTCEQTGKRYSEFSEKPTLLDSPLYYVCMQEDRRMLEFLIRHVDRDAPYHKGLYDAVLQYYLYMKLPDWGDLAELSGKQGELLDAVEKQADSIGVKRSPVLRTLFEAGFPSKYRKLPLKYSEVHIVRHPGTRKGYHFVEGRKDWSAVSQGNGHFGFYHNDSEMIRALTESGSFYPFICECGDPFCAGISEPVQCLKTPTGMRWYKPCPRPMSCIVFDPKPVLAELERAMTGIEEELTTEKIHGYDMVFPNGSTLRIIGYGPTGETLPHFKKDLTFCRRRLKRLGKATP